MNLILLSSQFDYSNSATTKPLGCYQLASWLRQHGFTVKVIDHCSVIDTATLKTMISKFVDDTTVAIGVSSTFWSKNERFEDANTRTGFSEPRWVLDIRDALEADFSKLDWLLGGYSAAWTYQLAKEWVRFIDYSEDSLLKYMNSKFNRFADQQKFDIESSTMQYHPTDFIQPQEALAMELGRGCQFKCKFCQYPHIGKKKGTYLRSIECIKNDLLYNYEHFGTTRYSFVDDTVNEDYDKIVALANMAQKLPFQLEWAGYNRIDLIWSRPDTKQILKDSGLKSSFFGIESFNPQVAKLVNKGWFGKHARDFVLELREYWGKDISFHLSFIVGFEEEDIHSVMKTADWLLENQFYSWFFHPLRIKRIPSGVSTVFVSEFEKNYADYGYRFPNPMSNDYWEHTHWNANRAIQISNICNKKLSGLMIPASFTIFEKTNLGYDTNDVLWRHRRDYDPQEDKNRFTQFIQNYVDATLTYQP
jgi:hypothetical protein